MKGKVTLITPPDIYENLNLSLLLINLNEQDQFTCSEYLGKLDNLENLNIYFYLGEPNCEWFFYSLARSQYKYIDIDQLQDIPKFLLGYILARPNVFYHTSDENIAALCQYINQNRVKSIEVFLDYIFKGSNEKQE